MTDQEKISFLKSPEKFWPSDIVITTKETQKGGLLGNSIITRSLYKHVQVLRESQYWDSKIMSDIQSARLRRLAEHIKKNSPYWSEYLLKNNFIIDSTNILPELNKLPILDKQAYMGSGSNSPFYIYPKEKKEQIVRATSGATTGRPLTLRYTSKEAFMKVPYMWRRQEQNLSEKEMENLLKRKFIISLGGGGPRRNNKEFIYKSFIVTHADLQNSPLRNQIYTTIKEAGPAFLIGYASLIVTFAQYVEEDAVSLPLIAVMPTSEYITLEDKAFIKKVFDAPVSCAYGSTEGGPIGFECPKNLGYYHLNSERIIMEIVDGAGEVVENGTEGEIVITVLDYFTSPIIRYSSGDMGKIEGSPCPCGRTLPLFTVEGRRGGHIKLPDGGILKNVILFSALRRSGLRKKSIQFQVKQISINRLEVLVVPRKKFSDSDELELRIALSELFGKEKVIIDIKYVEKIPSSSEGKPVFFIPLKE